VTNVSDFEKEKKIKQFSLKPVINPVVNAIGFSLSSTYELKLPQRSLHGQSTVKQIKKRCIASTTLTHLANIRDQSI